MAVADRIVLGAPGIYVTTADRVRALTGVRMDVAAFLGVAPRGPCRIPLPDRTRPDEPWAVDLSVPPLRSVAVAVESWDDYRRLYGSFEGAGRLPYAVATFFEQGGRLAYVVRIVHDHGLPADDAGGVAALGLAGIGSPGGGPVRLLARNEGVWGDALQATLSFRTRPVPVVAATATEVRLPPDSPLPAGSLLRFTTADGTRSLRFVSRIRDDPRPFERLHDRLATLDAPVFETPTAVDCVEAILELEDPDPVGRRIERHDGLGLSKLHPRWIAGVLWTASELVWPAADWADGNLMPDDPLLPPLTAVLIECGSDRSADIAPEDFFDAGWVVGDEVPGAGIQSLAELLDVSLIVAPDLYSPGPIADREWIADPVSLAGPEFATCVDIPPPVPEPAPAVDLAGLRLDPTLPDDLRRITELQGRMVDFADRSEGPIVLLDAPPGLDRRRLLRWRNAFDSAYAAAYHPWLEVARLDDDRPSIVRIGPSAVAAGIIARRERTSGVPYGPFNEIAAGVIDVADRVAPAAHDELHQEAINVFLAERDGVRLTAGRTLARDQQFRQLNVRRLITMLRRVLEQQMQFMVFEPNTPSLWASVRHMLRGFLGQLFQAGALAGATEEEAFFVRCDETLNPPGVVDAGRLIVEVGVAPVEPIEFIVIRFTRDGDGTIRAEGRRG